MDENFIVNGETFLVISKDDADILWPDGWTEDGIRQQGYLINKPIDENDLSLWNVDKKSN